MIYINNNYVTAFLSAIEIIFKVFDIRLDQDYLKSMFMYRNVNIAIVIPLYC